MLNFGITVLLSVILAFVYRKSVGNVSLGSLSISFFLYFMGNTLFSLVLIYLYNMVRGFPTQIFSKSHFIVILLLNLLMLISCRNPTLKEHNSIPQLAPKSQDQ